MQSQCGECGKIRFKFLYLTFMHILALDTSTEYLSLALKLGETILRYDELAGQSHSQKILPQIRALLDEANIELTDLDGIAFGAGPGSFTGVRIACGVSQGLAFGANLPVVGVNTLLVLAEFSLKESAASKVIACLDARMGEIYHAAFEKCDGVWQETSASGLFKPYDAPLVTGDDWVGAGSGWLTYGEQLGAIYESQLKASLPSALPTASSILTIATPLFEAGLGQVAHEATPIYIRNKVALKTAERALLVKTNGQPRK